MPSPRLIQLNYLLSSFFAASFNSPTKVFKSVECMEQAIDIGSPPKAGHEKQPEPKCFVKTSFVEGHVVVTSPVVISPEIFSYGILKLLSIKYFSHLYYTTTYFINI